MKKFRSILSFAFILMVFPSFAQETNEYQYKGTISPAAAFLAIPTDIKATAMGNLGAASPMDANAVFSNPARISRGESEISEISFTYTPISSQISKGINLYTLAGYTSVGFGSYAGVTLQYFTLGDVSFKDDSGNETQLIRPSDIAIGGFYSKKFSEELSLGITVKGVFSSAAGGLEYNNQATKKGISLATDFGMTGRKKLENNYVNYGIALKNIGTRMSYASSQPKSLLPMSLQLGGGYQYFLDEDNYVYAGLELTKSLLPGISNDPDLSVMKAMTTSFKKPSVDINIGVEASIANLVYLRTGYFRQPKGQGDTSFFSFGFGLYTLLPDSNRAKLDVAFLMPSGNNVIVANSLKLGITYSILDSYQK